MARPEIKLTDTIDYFFEDTALIGIASALPGHKLCWLLNNTFDINFCRASEHEIQLHKNTGIIYFPYYTYEVPDCNVFYTIYSLKNGSESLLPEIKQVDYLWTVRTQDYTHESNLIIAKLRALNDISLSTLFESDKIKNKKNLLL